MRRLAALPLWLLGACTVEVVAPPEPWPEPEPEPPVIARAPEVADPGDTQQPPPDDRSAALAKLLIHPQHTVRVGYVPASKAFVVVDRVPLGESTFVAIEGVARGTPAKVLLRELVEGHDWSELRERVAATLRSEKVGDALVLDAYRVPMSPKPPREVDVAAVAGKVVWRGKFAELVRKNKAPVKLTPPPGAVDVDWVVASPDGTLLLVSYLGELDELSRDKRPIRAVETVP